MGRYANFNTGLEYKFVFAVQSSEDITFFGGQWNQIDDIEWRIEWRREWQDLERCDKMLRLLESKLKITRPDLDKYAGTEKGSHDLLWAARDAGLDNTYCLGLVIYHQLQWIKDGVLIAYFES